LLPEPEACHFVPLGKTSSQQAIPVAVIEHEYLTSLLKEIEIYGWRLRMLVPDYLAMPEPEAGVWVMDASEQPFLLRFPQGQGGAVFTAESSSQLPGALRLALEQAANPPQTLRVRVTTPEQSNQIKAWSASLEAVPLQLDIQEDKHSRADWLARQSLPGTAYNLLTGPYKPSREGGLWRRQLLPTAILTGVFIVIAGLNWFVQGARLQTDYQALQAEIESTYREVFPETRNLVDPRFQMEQQLTSLREQQQTGGAGQDFLSRLDQIATVMDSAGDVRLQLLNFDGSSITMEVSVPDYDALDSLQLLLAETADVNVENAELRDGRVISRLRLRGQG
ncbi:MAG: type II secretion system protein GspL, partial [Gammaproteobacteria bacterium]